MLRNSLAHLIARIAALAAGIIVIPLVTLTLGTEALGLVGVYATLQAMLGLFDLGLPMATNHRLAVMIGRNAAPAQQSVLVRTLELLFWALVALFFFVGYGLRGPLAESWLNVTTLSRATVDMALALMIGAAAVRFPVAFYTNVLFAYDRHLFPNAVIAASAILRILASLIALVGFNVGIVGFFIIQLVGSVAEVMTLAGGVWLAQPHRWVAPRWAVLSDIGGMAGGLTLVSLTAVVLSQADKVILSKLLSLGDFGLYSAGYTLATGLAALSYPVGNAVFPQLSRALDARSSGTTRVVQAATELTILILVPLGAVMIVQTEPLLRLLFLVKPMPDTLAGILPLMMLGGMAQGFVTLPHLFQVAVGRVATVFWINAGFLLPYGIGVFAATSRAGIVGAAAAFAAFNIARLLAHWCVLLTSRRTKSAWWPSVTLTLALTAGGLIFAGAPLMIGISGPGAILVAILSVPALAMLASIAMPRARVRVLALWRAGISREGGKP